MYRRYLIRGLDREKCEYMQDSGCDCTDLVNLKQRKIIQSKKLCLVAEKITEHKEKRERACKEMRTCVWAERDVSFEREQERERESLP